MTARHRVIMGRDPAASTAGAPIILPPPHPRKPLFARL